MLNNDKILVDWVLNGCEYFHRITEGEYERFICDKNLTLGFTPERMYKYCTRECAQRVKQNHWVV